MLTANCTAAGMSAHVTGQGPSIVFLHSLLADRGSLEPMVPLLENDFRLVLFDLPGFGMSERCEAELEVLSDRIGAAVQALCPNEKPVLFGNGYGSFLALSTALRHPSIFRALCLAGCGATFNDEGRKAFLFMAARTREAGLAAIADVAMRRLFPPQLAQNARDIVDERRASFLKTDNDVFCGACMLLATLDLRQASRSLTIPLIACAGALDEATPPVMAEELASLTPRGRFELIEDCAHVPTLQAPTGVEALLRRLSALSTSETN